MSFHRILLVEDSREIQIVVCAALKKKYLVKAVSTSSEAMAEIKTQAYSLIILDVELPDGDGFKICAQVKLTEMHRNTQIIFLSGKNQIGDKIMGLSLGADDYIVKPFDLLEFLARVEARMRRLEETRQGQEQRCIGSFRIIPAQQKICVAVGTDETVLDLTNMEFKLLYFLLQHEDHILSREQILNAVWGQLANVSDRTVDTHIYTIRQKLGRYSPCIQAVPRVGYRYSQDEAKTAA